MKVKFIQELVTAIGTFVVDQVEELEDKHIISNWVEQGFIEIVEEIEELENKPKKKVVKKADK